MNTGETSGSQTSFTTRFSCRRCRGNGTGTSATPAAAIMLTNLAK